MIKVHFEYDDGLGCKTSYSKECSDDCSEYESELDTLNRLYLEFLMACGFPFTYKDEVIVVEDGDIETVIIDDDSEMCCECSCDEIDKDTLEFIMQICDDL